MSQKPETVFRAKFRKRLDAIANTWWESIQQKTICGTPDIIGCVGGMFLGLELKADDKSDVTPIQDLKLRNIAKAGGLGIVVRPSNADDVIDLILNIVRKEHANNNG